MARQANPHQHELGYITSRANPLTGGYCVLYDGSQTGIEQSGRWTIICTAHGAISNYTNKKIATGLLREPDSWCPSCHETAAINEAEYVLTLRAVRNTEEQLRRLAHLALGNPEKCQLFERLTGKQPDRYLSELK